MGLLVAAALFTSAPATDDAVSLLWEAPAECPDRDAVVHRVHELLAASTIAPDAKDVRATARIETTPRGYALELHFEGDVRSDRRIESSDCNELAHAAALILSIAVDPSAAWSTDTAVVPDPSPAAPEDAIAQPGPTPATVLPVSSAAPQPMAERRRRPAFALRGGVGIDALVWRPVGASLVLAAAVVGREYRVELAARYATPSTISADSSDDVQVRAQQWSIGLAGCGVPTFGSRRQFEVPLCGAIEAGAMHARGLGPGLAGRSNVAPWVGLAAGPSFVYVLRSSVGLWLAADAVVLVGRPRFVTDEGTVVLHPRRAGLRALAGVEVRFGGSR
jgi:hypothetical protein